MFAAIMTVIWRPRRLLDFPLITLKYAGRLRSCPLHIGKQKVQLYKVGLADWRVDIRVHDPVMCLRHELWFSPIKVESLPRRAYIHDPFLSEISRSRKYRMTMSVTVPAKVAGEDWGMLRELHRSHPSTRVLKVLNV
jgi:hypothetical protein